jgi:hypothetical protein
MIFLETIKNSIYNPEFYQELKQKRTRSSFGYFFKLAILLSFTSTVFFSAVLMPPLSRFLSNENLQNLIKLYPADLTLNVQNEQISTNVVEPRFVDFNVPLPPAKKHFLVIDTKTPVSLDNFKQYGAVIWIAKESIVIENNTKITIQTLKGIPNIILSRETINTQLVKMRPVIKLLPLFLICGIFIVMVVSHVFKLLYLLIFALLVMFLASTRNLKLTYDESYRYAIHLITLPLLIDILLILVPGFTRGIPFLFTAIAIVTTLFNLKQTPPPPVTTVSETPKPPQT